MMARAKWRLTACGAMAAVCGAAILLGTHAALAALTPTQKKDLTEIRADVTKAAGLIKKKQLDEAEEILDKVDQRVKQVQTEAMAPDSEPMIASLRKFIETTRKGLGKGADKPQKASSSFVADVAPLLTKHCGECHGENAAGGLRLDSFASLEKGGRTPPLLQVGNPNASLIIQRLVSANPQTRMPKNAEPLSREDCAKIAAWIAAGAKFDGDDRTAMLADVRKAGSEPPPTLEAATGNEKVSFKRDLAEVFSGSCGNCHSAQRKLGGLSLASYESMMRGGASGKVIVPGKPKESRLWRLVWAEDEPVMPQGNQARIPRKWAENLTVWIEEGARFDGGDPKRPIRDLVPTEEEKLRAELGKLSPEGWLTKRREQADSMWKKTVSSGKPTVVESDELLVYGDATSERLEEIRGWADEQLKSLKPMFGIKDSPTFHGRLPVFVFQDRFSYEEFHRMVQKRDVPKEIIGYSEAAPLQDDVYVVVQDVGDNGSAGNPGMRLNVVQHVSGAVLKRGGDLPDWLVRGAGLALSNSAKAAAGPYLADLKREAAGAVKSVDRPDAVFREGTFAPGDADAVGYALVEFLLKQGGQPSFAQLVKRLQNGDSPADAVQATYRAEAGAVATGFIQSLGSTAPGKTKKK